LRCVEVGRCQLAASGVAAAWRLGRWEQLHGYLAAANRRLDCLDAEERWEVRCTPASRPLVRPSVLQSQAFMCTRSPAPRRVAVARMFSSSSRRRVTAHALQLAAIRFCPVSTKTWQPHTATCQTPSEEQGADGIVRDAVQFGFLQVRIGGLLATVAAGDSGSVAQGLQLARQEIMAPLSAASMESYTRAYPHLIKLHMLQELADAHALMQARARGAPSQNRPLL
jgi:FAT domain